MTTEDTEQKWSHWAGGLTRQVQMSAILLIVALKSDLNIKGGLNKQVSCWAGVTVPV